MSNLYIFTHLSLAAANVEKKIGNVKAIFDQFSTWLYAILGVIAGFFIVVEVINAIKSGGDEHAKSAAKKQIGFIIGMAGGAYILVEIVKYVITVMKV